MLFGTEIANVYAQEYEPVASAAPMQKPAPPTQAQQHPKDLAPPANSNAQGNMDPNFLTSDQKLYLLSSELQKQREHFQQLQGNSYMDKLLSKKKDLMKLVVISFVVLFAMSLHFLVVHYLKQYLEESMFGPGQEFLVRMLYPALVLFMLWNFKALGK